ncbi:hypothetical protein PXH59_00795 [Xenorhabdus sp. SF857]|uniref:hypothetical protein n=1 Tax=Xenorhabdus bakwenae TaxID=3026967 RepID=UPI002557E998|nr:hypothetical protein [Xenorhabdus sp. SF857]WFQ79778.1 hypothetical protein PXH59_00745 [Xenorhabdus sp. SF857]WFQ79788.1 hypothetical protein PXH59_00795 [Xenorhabdus sp. SF857]
MPEQRKAAKEDVILPERGTVLRVGAGLWPGSAQKLTAEGAALCGAPCDADKRGRQT